MRICYSGIRFFYQHVLKRDWSTLSLIRAQTAHRLPAVLSVEEVRRLRAAIRASAYENHLKLDIACDRLISELLEMERSAEAPRKPGG